MDRSTPPPPNLPALTSVRFFAAAHVILMHYCQRLGDPASIGFPSAAFETVISAGYMVLQMFFVLSGFVLAWNYSTSGGQLKGTRGDFWAARVARIYPAYLLSLLISLPVFVSIVVSGQSPSPAAPPLTNPAVIGATIVTTPLLLQSWFGLIGWNPVGWSLSAEAFFYALFPLLLPRVCRLSIRGLYGAAAAACALSLLPAILCVAMAGTTPIATAPWYPMNMRTMFEGALYASPLLRLPEFFVGVVLGRLARLYRESDSHLPAWTDAAIVPMVIPLILATAWLPGPIFSRLHLPYLGLFVYSLAEQRGPVARLLSHPFLEYLGEISFSIYLLHDPIVLLFFRGVERSGATWVLGWTSYLAVVVVVVLVAAAAHRLIEVPGRRWVRQSFAELTGPPRLASPSNP